jgi:LysM repeat protein
MKRKLYITVLVVFGLALVLSACSMPAPKPATAQKSSTPAGELPFPVTTQSDLVKDILNATQTAIAKSGQPVQEGTPQPTDDQAGGGVNTEEATPNPDDQVGGGAPNATAVRRTSRPRPAPEEPGRPSSYVVQKGDFIYCLARRFDVAPADLLAANGGSTVLYPGQTLGIPQDSTWPSSLGSRSLRSHPATYTVLAGDTLNKIACVYGDVYPEQIAEYNDIDENDSPTPGATLDIP